MAFTPQPESKLQALVWGARFHTSSGMDIIPLPSTALKGLRDIVVGWVAEEVYGGAKIEDKK